MFDHEVALSASITISSSLTTITRDTLTVSDDDDDDDDDDVSKPFMQWIGMDYGILIVS